MKSALGLGDRPGKKHFVLPFPHASKVDFTFTLRVSSSMYQLSDGGGGERESSREGKRGREYFIVERAFKLELRPQLKSLL